MHSSPETPKLYLSYDGMRTVLHLSNMGSEGIKRAFEFMGKAGNFKVVLGGNNNAIIEAYVPQTTIDELWEKCMKEMEIEEVASVSSSPISTTPTMHPGSPPFVFQQSPMFHPMPVQQMTFPPPPLKRKKGKTPKNMMFNRNAVENEDDYLVAGFFPFIVHEGKCLVLLMGDKVGKQGIWNVFSTERRTDTDKDIDSICTSARAFVEQTKGLCIPHDRSTDDLTESLNHCEMMLRNPRKARCVYSAKLKAIMYICNMENDKVKSLLSIPETFEKLKSKDDPHQLEFIELKDIFNLKFPNIGSKTIAGDILKEFLTNEETKENLQHAVSDLRRKKKNQRKSKSGKGSLDETKTSKHSKQKSSSKNQKSSSKNTKPKSHSETEHCKESLL